MKKLLAILVLGLLWCNAAYSKEFESIYGFTFNLPGYYSVKRHSPDVDKTIMDKETKEIIKAIQDSGTLLGIIEFYKDKRYSRGGITIQFQNYYEDSNPIITEQDVKNLCSEVVEFWKGRGVKKEVYECGLIDTPKGVAASYYMESSGADKRIDKMLAANFLIDGKVFQVMGGCAEKNCKKFKKDFFQVLDTMSFANNAEAELHKNVNDFEKQFISTAEYRNNSNEAETTMVDLGWYNFTGEKGFRQSNQRAIFWNEKASQFGHPTGTYNLGLFYYAGLAGFEQSLEKAHSHLLLAFEQWKEGKFMFGIESEQVFFDEMNQYYPNPKKEFANLRDLFVVAIELPSNQRYERLKNLTNLAELKDEKITVETFIKNGKITCSEIYGGKNTRIHILKKLSDGNFLIQYFQGDPSSPDTFGTAEEDKLDVINFAVFTNEKFEWFEIRDEFFGLPPSITYFSVYAKDNNKKLIFQRIDGDITKPEFKKLNRFLSKANKYKKSDIGGTKHIEFAYLFHNDANAVLRSARIDKNDKFICD